MAQTCGKCNRVNPPEAAYCYFDGTALGGAPQNGSRVATAAQLFPTPFVFPRGRACRTFDELAVACHGQWAAARELLRQGYFESFLKGLGRSDLAQAALDAAHFLDPDRGLDQLLARLPTGVLDDPKLRVSPREIHLGQLLMGENRAFDLRLENQGMRLLYGSVSCDECNWLTLGDGKGAMEKHFQIGSEAVIAVHVQGQRLRAGVKPLEGRLLVDSNGGTETVVIRADVPPKPFPTGVLAGALSPRQLAEKARTAPKAAAEFFESGAVARWYKENGWTYPVSGPAFRGAAAVQQFFEVLGLAAPPRVELSETSIALRGAVGESVEHLLQVKSAEQRPRLVFAHAVSNQSWLEIGRAKLNGNTASIPLVVPIIPDRLGHRLTARVAVIANGNQRFVVPVTLLIGDREGANEAAPSPQESMVDPPRAKKTVLHSGIIPRRTRLVAAFRLAWPAAVLLLLLLGVLGWDAFHREAPDVGLLDHEPRLDARFNETMRFGIVMLKEPDPQEPGKNKRLTFDEYGATNNTCLTIDDDQILFGKPPGRWVRDARKGDLRKVEVKNKGWRSEWEVPNSDMRVTQLVQLIPGEQTRVLDTYLIRYTVENRSKDHHEVGLRVMLDTFVGANDGSPFVIPGQPGMLQTMHHFSQKEIPDYVQALEHDDLTNPGTVAHLGLKGLRLPNVDLELAESMLICRYPGNSEVRWNWNPEPIDKDPNRKDSCVVLYWAVERMNPGERREMAFTYGLNAVTSDSGGELGLTVGGDFRPGGEFSLTAYVKKPNENQKVMLLLPSGLSLLEGESAEQTVSAAGDYSQVSWRMRAESIGTFTPTVVTGLARQSRSVRISDKGLFD